MSLKTNDPLIQSTVEFTKAQLANAEGGHDWFHVERVFRNAMQIAKHETVNTKIVALAALLHDIADPKFHDGDESIGPDLARKFLNTHQVESSVIDHVIDIIRHMSFKNSLDPLVQFESQELFVVRDADRLDAIGAIGIARCFNYGGFKNRPLYDPEVPPNLNMTKEDYKKSQAPTINHFYEKLLRLKSLMHTKTGQEIAEKRHHYMEQYLEQFYEEWHGKR
ncbi:MAG: HD domain-containing protein [Bacteroidia bacterium]|nr:HD domain-containing protein [Bacteroidia bacterium]MBT8288323.1 HD domain-containing protein [Bacteroidia bacterium]NNK73819.1 HD domain-containing protein [Flavobacteriaceae bacterium]